MYKRAHYLIGLMLLAGPRGANAQPGLGSVTGRVLDSETRRPLANASIQLFTPGGVQETGSASTTAGEFWACFA
jgi:hypothetical protein